MASEDIRGIHHITAIAADPQRNVDFYAGTLGLRLVKRTVNFDDPGTYHLYYGNERGEPGTILTFFPWPGVPRGVIGNSQVTTTAFSIPESSVDYWRDRLAESDVEYEGPSRRFQETALAFGDPDGLQLELVAEDGSDAGDAWSRGPVPAEHAIRGFHSAALSEETREESAALLTETFGFRLVGEEGDRYRYRAAADGPGATVDLLSAPDAELGQMGAGTVHHIAWRVPDDDLQLQRREQLVEMGYGVTPVLDRSYFRSIYFREPGGVLFEIATDPPGFTADEAVEDLGTSLKLPPWLEPVREAIERMLPPVDLPELP